MGVFGPTDPEADRITAFAAELIAPDPAGLEPRRAYEEYYVEPLAAMTPSPPGNYLPDFRQGVGSRETFPGPPATAFVNNDIDSARWWGKGFRTIFAADEFTSPLPPQISPDIFAHVDVWGITEVGRYPNIKREEPIPYGSQVPEFDPNSLLNERLQGR